MPPQILVLDRNDASRQSLCRFLNEEQYATVTVAGIKELEPLLKREEPTMLLFDLDTVQATQWFIRQLRRRHPLLQIICFSSRSFHPELEQAMRTDICACLRKPVDPEELLYWLRAIYKDDFSSRDSPEPPRPG